MFGRFKKKTSAAPAAAAASKEPPVKEQVIDAPGKIAQVFSAVIQEKQPFKSILAKPPPLLFSHSWSGSF